MKHVEYKINVAEVVKALTEKGHSLHTLLRRGLTSGMRQFESRMIRQQFTGRPGLKRPTGTAAGSWHVETRGSGLETVCSLSNRSYAWYILVHQHVNFNGWINHPGGTPYVNIGGKSRWMKKDGSYPKGTKFTKPHMIYIPKRLHITEDFAANGYRIIRSSMLRTIQREVTKK